MPLESETYEKLSRTTRPYTLTIPAIVSRSSTQATSSGVVHGEGEHLHAERLLEEVAARGQLVVDTSERRVEVEPQVVPELENRPHRVDVRLLERVVEPAVEVEEVRRSRAFLRFDARERKRALDREVEVVAPEGARRIVLFVEACKAIVAGSEPNELAVLGLREVLRHARHCNQPPRRPRVRSAPTEKSASTTERPGTNSSASCG